MDFSEDGVCALLADLSGLLVDDIDLLCALDGVGDLLLLGMDGESLL